MRFKIDENMPVSAGDLLKRNGHEVHTVFDEFLNGTADGKIADVCQKEQRIILTLDIDFADIRTFPPKNYHGIIVLRPRLQSEPQILKLLDFVLTALKTEPIDGSLWIVDPVGMRIRCE
ncbi:hypothetical protein FACS1894189_2000 [Planctomycetales bacterium]|nr:hypothetical protein FACS1894189_2000 [Planctomycetales bacterium]